MIRRKPHQIELHRSAYRIHVRKLEELSSNKNPILRTMQKERKKIEEMLRKTHKIHNQSLEYELKKRENIEFLTHRINFENIQSVLKSELNRETLTVPNKHKINLTALHHENAQLVNKILNIKSTFNFREPLTKNELTNRAHMGKSSSRQDYSKIYEQSKIWKKHREENIITFKLGKGVNVLKYYMNFLEIDNVNTIRQNNIEFTIKLQSKNKVKRSKIYSLNDIFKSRICVQIAKKYIEDDFQIHFCELVGEKQILRFKVAASADDWMTENGNEQIQNLIFDSKDRPIGLIEMQKVCCTKKPAKQCQTQIVGDLEKQKSKL